jgi:preprotein translocase SecE subunit
MDNQYQKWVNICYLAAAALLGYVFFAFGLRIAGAYDLETRVRNIELMIRLGSIVIGALCFFLLYRHEKANQFMNEVVVELSRVTWPTQKETTSATIVVVVMVVISGMLLGFFDYVWTRLMQLIL